MSQGQLAQATRLSRTYVYHLEKGMRGHPSPRVAGNIVRALQLHGEDVRQFAEAYTQLTGHYLDAAAIYAEARPEPSFVFQVQHSELGRLTLRTATTVFTGIAN